MRGYGSMEVLENCYLVNFEVDNGVCHIMSDAIVFAINPDDAINKVKKFIGAIDSESYVEKVISCREYNGTVFTDKFGWR